jgi:hypothetical protein
VPGGRKAAGPLRDQDMTDMSIHKLAPDRTFGQSSPFSVCVTFQHELCDLGRFLMIADGVVRAQNRKIIFTTNLPNIGSIDEALLRPGRCFATIQMRPLSPTQSDAILSRLLPGNPSAVALARETLFATGRNGSSLAAIYRAASA